MQNVVFRDLGKMDYLSAWNYQETLLQENVQAKMDARKQISLAVAPGETSSPTDLIRSVDLPVPTVNYLLLLEHLPVYTLGKSGLPENILITEREMEQKGIDFFKTNRGGDITFHGPEQLVGYPILDLEKFYTDIGRYLRDLEEVIIRTIATYGLKGERSPGETGVWLEPAIPGKARKICAMGVRCSRWITMHGFALNVNTDLSYFDHIIPCGIQNKQVTSLKKELNATIPMQDVKERVKQNFEEVFNVKTG
ncbi:MAG: lipoyl(octanoyl) transferase LipB [Chitinophagaceae bacterium]